MDQLIENFPFQLEDALSIASKNSHQYDTSNVSNIIICGLGGSGIGGTICSNLLSSVSPYPIIVHKNYNVPAFVDKNTLAIVYSYSGNTEETLDALNHIISKTSIIYTVSSGGKLKEISLQNSIPFIEIPGGMPPRSTIGYSLVQILNILKNNDVVNEDYLNPFKNFLQHLKHTIGEIKIQAKDIASKLHNRLPIIYSDANIEGVSIRFRQQLNENSKMLCWHNVLPEMNHNELVGWTQKENHKTVVFFRNSFENERTKLRFEFLQQVIEQYCDNIITIDAKGNTFLEQSLYLIHLGDWISFYVAELKKVDPIEVQVIDNLKAVLDNK